MMAQDPNRLVEVFFKEKWRDAIVVLTRRFGPQHLDEIENAVQTAMLRALDSWRSGGQPRNPGGWIVTVAKNELIDRFRHRALVARRSDDVSELFPTIEPEPQLWSGPLEDEVLKMIFVCCHPALSARGSIAVTLRLICGLGVREIAKALLTTEDAAKKLLVRTKSKIRERGLPFEIPDHSEIESRRERALHVIYLLFNEGYAAHTGEELIRAELCQEARRLVDLLLRSRIGQDGPVWGLAALIALQSSRLPARVDSSGRLLRLEEQDRGRWDRVLIEEGFAFLERSMAGAETSKYHLEAAIAACHAIAPSYEATDWLRIREFYDDLAALAPSPVVELNRSVAVMMTEGPRAGIALLERIQAEGSLANSHLLPALLADFHLRAQHDGQATRYFERALTLTENLPAKRFLQDQIEAIEPRTVPRLAGHPSSIREPEGSGPANEG